MGNRVISTRTPVISTTTSVSVCQDENVTDVINSFTSVMGGVMIHQQFENKQTKELLKMSEKAWSMFHDGSSTDVLNS